MKRPKSVKYETRSQLIITSKILTSAVRLETRKNEIYEHEWEMNLLALLHFSPHIFKHFGFSNSSGVRMRGGIRVRVDFGLG
jgi:hypothetical protein